MRHWFLKQNDAYNKAGILTGDSDARKLEAGQVVVSGGFKVWCVADGMTPLYCVMPVPPEPLVVWVVTFWQEYEGETYCGTFSSLSKADEYVHNEMDGGRVDYPRTVSDNGTVNYRGDGRGYTVRPEIVDSP